MVKVDAEVVRVAKSVAAFREMSLAEYLSTLLGPIVNKEFESLHIKHPRKPDARPAPE